MSAAMEDILTVADNNVVTSSDAEAMERNMEAVMAQNLAATSVEAESLDAFMDLLSAADPEYIDAAAYAVPTEPENIVDWDTVTHMLEESQAILISVQELLRTTLEGMGVEDSEFIRVYSDMNGGLRLLADHPRKLEIEGELNSAGNAPLREMYTAAVNGMGLAGGLVGAVAVPEEVLERVKAKKVSAA